MNRLPNEIMKFSDETRRNSYAQIKEYFEHALKFILKHVPQERILSAVIHVDEKTPHMHLSFVPITEDGRLSAKDIVGNRKKLTWWQDEFWKHMVKDLSKETL